ncbi:SDR family NAD(P)-dependent oxidoreductase [Kutzneria chonburiensis]|uniref:SDR family NAD(P)-dependent oxidoreductase n=1 Tax=Kutzneria chonburiensis TaxID=1483604 RepID=A0ABV6MQH0_9PSEU|nr:SDR family NAD(P)-dependent oxidoreductase [Kutzneria chonburiensis]
MRSVIVTGAGSGIGRAAALQFAAAGDWVVVADVNGDAAMAVVAEIDEAGGKAVAATGDLADRAAAEQVVATAVSTFGGVDVLVNNAGVMDSMSAVADTSDEMWERVLGVNLTAPFLLTRAALPHMLAKERGAIVFTASEAGLRGSASGAAYTASKHGLIGLMRNVAIMYRDKGIRANAIAPGGTRTNISVQADPTTLGPQVVGRYLGNAGRIADADEQAAAIVFLASDAASNINGVVLPVDNGWSAV